MHPAQYHWNYCGTFLEQLTTRTFYAVNHMLESLVRLFGTPLSNYRHSVAMCVYNRMHLSPEKKNLYMFSRFTQQRYSISDAGLHK